MIVYGDHARTAEPTEVLAFIRQLLDSPADQPVERHGRLVAALIEAGQLVQAVADDDMYRDGHDRLFPAERSLMGLTHALADAVMQSWTSGFAPAPAIADWRIALSERACAGRPEHVLREPEGYAHYALYPEAYGLAASRLAGPLAGVIGIRSIGTSLAAVVAAAKGLALPLTVRPVGHPFDRRLSLAPSLLPRLVPPGSGTIAVVDEGPGLSGSSFGAVADALDQQGVGPDRIVFFPSHSNEPGAQASARHRARWAASRRLVVTFDDMLAEPQRPEQRLEHWVRDITGKAHAPLLDIAGGRWRTLQDGDASRRPPADAPAEKRKFLLDGGNGTFLLRFSGLGHGGMRRFELQRRLGEAGFALPPSGWRHGFTVEPWRGDLLSLDEAAVDRSSLVEQVGAYLAFRARTLPVAGLSGASAEALHTMAACNVTEAFGAEAGTTLDRWRPLLPKLEAAVRRVVTDNRLHGWEWRVTHAGRIVKTDAVDHHAGHDLIGCQDVGWDVAGAVLELGFTSEERAVLLHILGRAAVSPDPDLLAFYELAYPAFQLGLATLAAGRNAARDAERWSRHAARYRTAIEQALEQTASWQS